MKTLTSSSFSQTTASRKPTTPGFTLMETVIAIGVLAVLLTGFIAVFAPAAQGIRRSISTQQADRLATTLEKELVTLRNGQNNGSANTGFEKAYNWIDQAEGDPTNPARNAIFVYQYRGNPSSLRADGTPKPLSSVTGQPGVQYTIQSVARRASEPEFTADLDAIDGPIFYVKPTQLIQDLSEMKPGTFGTIANRTETPPLPTPTSATDYKDAVIPFSAEFFSVPSKAASYITGNAFKERYKDTTVKPVFTRNLAARR